MKLMYWSEPIDLDICPPRQPSIRSLRSAWDLVFPAMRDELSCIQVSGKYIVSLGAHFARQHVLLSKKHPIDYLTAQEVCNLLSFIFDAVVDVGVSLNPSDAKNSFSGLVQYFRMKGITLRDLRALQTHLAMPKAVVEEILMNDGYQRLLPREPLNDGKFMACQLPTDLHLRDALLTYRLALLSVDPTGAILNYWRVLEATTKTTPRGHCFLMICSAQACSQ